MFIKKNNSNSKMIDSTIPEYYKSKNVFITGGTGFMGKVLVEKLLRSCPDLNTIYLLIRNKKNEDVNERWEKITQLPLFDKLKKEKPDNLNKVRLIKGTIDENDLSLNPDDKKLLVENVDIVFHCAAAVQFSESIIYSLKQNTKGTYTVAELAKSMKNLKCFVYASTAYSNCDKNVTIEEKLYPPPHDWKVLLKVLETDPESLSLVKDKLSCGHPSTYTLTKALGEQVMNDYSQYYPVVIVRPSVVIGALEDPLPGWCDALNAASMLIMISGLGLVRVMKAIPSAYLDYITVDHAIKVLIIGSWMTGKRENVKTGVEVLSCNYGKEITLSIKEMNQIKNEILDNVIPTTNLIWYPMILTTFNPVFFTILLFLVQIFPSMIFDLILKSLGKPAMAMHVTKKYVQAFSGQLSSFTMKQFSFPNDNFKNLMNAIKSEDKNEFSINTNNLTPREVFKINIKGTLQYYLHEDMSENTFEKRKNHVKRMKYIHYMTCGLIITGFCVFLCKYILFFIDKF